MSASLQKIKKLNPEIIPPQGAVPIGVTTDGKQLYRLEVPRSRAVPDIDPATGERRYRKNQQTGEPLYPLNRPELYTDVQTFFLESEGNGNVRKVPYTPPTEAELALADRAAKVASMQLGMAEAFVDAGVTPEEMISRVMGTGPEPEPQEPQVAQEPVVEETVLEYPNMYAPGRWQLSNGDKMQGKEVQAQEAEDAIATAKEHAAATPEI